MVYHQFWKLFLHVQIILYLGVVSFKKVVNWKGVSFLWLLEMVSVKIPLSFDGIKNNLVVVFSLRIFAS